MAVENGDPRAADLGERDGSPRAGTVARAYADTGVLYELPVHGLELNLGGIVLDVSDILGSGRSNYMLFQKLAALCTGMRANSEGSSSDLRAADGTGTEVKAYYDHEAFPSVAAKYATLHTAASSTFGPNNLGPQVSTLLRVGDYAGALAVCRATGYDKNDYYLYTNTREFRVGTPFRYVILPTATVLASLSPEDPRVLPRTALLEAVTRTVRIDPAEILQAG